MVMRRRTTTRRAKRRTPTRLYKVVCAGCEKEVRIEVPPPIGKSLFCLECYKK